MDIEFDMSWDSTKIGPDLAFDGARKTVTHTTSSGWSCQVADRVFAEGVHHIELWCENVDNLGLFVGVAGRSFLDAHDFEDSMRESPDVCCIHGDGRVFVRKSERDWGLQRMATGRKIDLMLDIDSGILKLHLENVNSRGQAVHSNAEITGLPAQVVLAVCFGGKDQALRIGRCLTLPKGDPEARERRLARLQEAEESAASQRARAEAFEAKVQSFLKTAKETAT